MNDSWRGGKTIKVGCLWEWPPRSRGYFARTIMVMSIADKGLDTMGYQALVWNSHGTLKWKIMSLWRKWHSGIVILNIAGVLVSVVGNISMKRRLTQPVPHVKGPQRRTGNFFYFIISTTTHTYTIHWISYGVWCLTITLSIHNYTQWNAHVIPINHGVHPASIVARPRGCPWLVSWAAHSSGESLPSPS